MKKSKIVIAILLAAAIVVLCVSVPTFSWFTRPQEHSGNKLGFGEESDEYYAYNGKSVEITTTYKTNDDGVTFTDSVSDFNGTNITAYNRNYYCTTIHNRSNTEQNVSLYATTLTSNIAQFALGVNGPTRTYRDYTKLSAGSSTKSTGTTMRVYFKRPDDYSDWLSGDYDIYWWDNNYHNGYVYDVIDCHYNNGNAYYFADIPKIATGMIIKIAGSNLETEPTKKSEDINLSNTDQSDINSRVFIMYNQRTGNQTVKVGSDSHVDGANFVEWYDTISIVNGSFYDAGISYPQAIGNITYSSSNSSVFTVDSKGKITTVGIGQATLTTTATGQSYNDTTSQTTTVTVTETSTQVYHDVPIVKNIKIPACNNNGNTHTDTVDPDCEVKVYWYVVNNSSTGTALTYTIDNLYLGL